MRLATRVFWLATLMGLAIAVVALGIAYRADRNREYWEKRRKVR
ncbi:MAG: hypothetical protein AAB368_05235 [bacterium]